MYKKSHKKLKKSLDIMSNVLHIVGHFYLSTGGNNGHNSINEDFTNAAIFNVINPICAFLVKICEKFP